jgi:hypothetical protein
MSGVFEINDGGLKPGTMLKWFERARSMMGLVPRQAATGLDMLERLEWARSMMCRIGWLTSQKGSKLEVLVWADDPCHTTPHAHIVDAATLGNQFNSCVKLLSAEYFPHKGKQCFPHEGKRECFQHEGKSDVLTSKQMKELNALMHDGWGFIVRCWNSNNDTTPIPSGAVCSDYTKLHRRRAPAAKRLAPKGSGR